MLEKIEMSSKDNNFYTCKEVADIFAVARQTVWDWINAKKLPAFRIGKEYRIAEKDLNELLTKRKTI
jgi:excisionase family DNA binding protein